MANRISQEPIEVVELPTSQAARVSQEAIEVVELPTSQTARISQAVIEVITTYATAVLVSQAVIEVVLYPPTPTIGPDPACGTFREMYYVSASLMGNGLPALLMRAERSPYGSGQRFTLFVAYQTEYNLSVPIELFLHASTVLGLALFKGTLVAVVQNSSNVLRVRTSMNDGASWTDETTLLTFTHPSFNWAAHATISAFRLVTSRDGQRLYIFYQEHTGAAYTNRLMYRYTDTSATVGWSGEFYSGFTVPSVARNYGGTTARNQQDTRAFGGPIETKTPGTWVLTAESDDGDWHANHAIFRGTLGGAWLRVYNSLGYGGGLSGGQGANGNVFHNQNGDLIAYAMSDDGNSTQTARSTDSGLTWGTLTDEIGGVVSVGTGAGDGLPAFNNLYIWSGLAGLAPGSSGLTTDLFITEVGVPSLDFYSILGQQQLSGYICTLQFVPSYNSCYHPLNLTECVIAAPLMVQLLAKSQVEMFHVQYVSSFVTSTTLATFDGAVFDPVIFNATDVMSATQPTGRLFAQPTIDEIVAVVGTTKN